MDEETKHRELLNAYTQLAEAVRALDAAWPSLEPNRSARAEDLLWDTYALLHEVESELFPLLGLPLREFSDRHAAPDPPPRRDLP